MRLNLRALSGSNTQSLDVPEDASIGKIAHMLRASLGGQHSKVPQLIWQTTVLSDHVLAKDLGITDGSNLQVVWPASTLPPRCLQGPPVLRKAVSADCLESFSAECEIDVSGRRLPLPQFVMRLPTALVALDIRRCGNSPAELEELFRSLPAGLVQLRAGYNNVTNSAVVALAELKRALKTLDLGMPEQSYSDSVENQDDVVLSSLWPLLGEHLEELDISEHESLEVDDVPQIIEVCPMLRVLNISGIGHGDAGGSFPALWKALSTQCPHLQELVARSCPFLSAESFRGVLLGCPKLSTFVGESEDPVWSPIASELEGRAFEAVEWKTDSYEDLVALAKLETNWLYLTAEDEHFIDPLQSLESTFLDSVRTSSATDLCFELPYISEALLVAAGNRLRQVRADYSPEGPRIHLVHALTTMRCCPNLLELHVDFWEQLSSEDVATLAVSCPLLHTLRLTADEDGCQREALDEGVRALSRHCPDLRVLDLYDRKLATPARTLAEACQGWPKLEYLCAAGTGESRWSRPENECLPKALAEHCPLLEQLVLYFAPISWKSVLEIGCPFIDPSCFGGQIGGES